MYKCNNIRFKIGVILIGMMLYLPAQAQQDSESNRQTSAMVEQIQLNQVNTPASSNLAALQTNRNITIVQQVGNYNSVFTSAVSGTATLEYLQVGNKNNIQSINGVNDISERIFQNGENNSVLNYSFGPVNTSSLNIIQNGNNLSIQKFGTNSQTNNMAFRLSGNNQSVIVRSF